MKKSIMKIVVGVVVVIVTVVAAWIVLSYEVPYMIASSDGLEPVIAFARWLLPMVFQAALVGTLIGTGVYYTYKGADHIQKLGQAKEIQYNRVLRAATFQDFELELAALHNEEVLEDIVTYEIEGE